MGSIYLSKNTIQVLYFDGSYWAVKFHSISKVFPSNFISPLIQSQKDQESLLYVKGMIHKMTGDLESANFIYLL